MSKFLKVMIVLLTIVAVATPAMAEIKLNGYFRVQGEMFDDGTTTESYFVQRTRLKLTNQLNENVKLVYYAEADTDWGQAGKGPGAGAQLGNDGVLIETKHAYIATNYDGFTTTTGLQAYGTNFNSVYLDDDGAGFSAGKTFGPATVSAWYAKFSEGEKAKSDDIDAYGLTASFAASDAVTVEGKFNYYNSNEEDLTDPTDLVQQATLMVYGVSADVKIADNMSVNALLAAESYDEDNTSVDGSSWFLDAAYKVAFGSGAMKVRAFYSPAADDEFGADKIHGVSGWAFYEDNLLQLGTNAAATNNGSNQAKFEDALYGGYGLMALTVSGSYTGLPMDTYLKYGIAYMAADDEANNSGAATKADTELGTEVALTVGKKFLENVDLSVRGSYLATGDFYDEGAGVDDQTTVIAMMNVSF